MITECCKTSRMFTIYSTRHRRYLRPRARKCSFLVDESAMHRLYGQAVHLMLYRAEHGAFPPKVIGGSRVSGIDPFTRADLIYKPTAKGFTIYSVGRDLIDNGGDGTNAY